MPDAIQVHVTRSETDNVVGPSFGCLPGTTGYRVVLTENVTGTTHNRLICVADPDPTGANFISAIEALDDGGWRVIDP